MRKQLSLAILLIASSAISKAQMTLEHNYPQYAAKGEMVNLLISGRKYAIQEKDSGSIVLKAIKLYNTNHSLWKTIIPPAVAGCTPYEAFYISENLFTLNGKIAMQLLYSKPPMINFGKCVIIDEDGNILNDIDNASYMTVYNAGNNSFKAIVNRKGNGVDVYSLPGTIPNSLGNGLGIAKTSDVSSPVPNPSKSEVRIEYRLPEGINEGVLELYATNGIKIKSFKIDRNFSYLKIDNADLPAGTYYYNISARGEISESQKMVVIK